MKLIEAVRLALGAIISHKLRSFLTLLGIIFGVATVIVVVSLIDGFNGYVEEKIANLGSNAFVVNRLGFVTSLDEYIERDKHNKDIKMADMDAILEHPTYIKTAAAMVTKRGDIKLGTKTLDDFTIRGVSYNMIDIDTMKVADGRYFSTEEQEHSEYVCFVGSDVANQLFPTSSALGKEIKVEGLPFRIIGVAEELGTIFGNPQDNFVLMPITTYQRIYGTRDSISIRVAAIDPNSIESAQDEVRMIIRARRHLRYNDKDNFGIITSDAINNLRKQIFGTVSIVAVGVTSIALIVGGIVIMNMMLVSVTERTHEIGIRKSLGAKRVDILKQFLAESTALSLFGGAVGVGMAWSIARIATAALSIPTSLPLLATFMALMVSGSIGLFFGIYPAWKAAKLDPIQALRAE